MSRLYAVARALAWIAVVCADADETPARDDHEELVAWPE